MPLQGKAKADYQRKYMLGYMRRRRSCERASGLNASVKTTVKTPTPDVKTKELTYERDDYSQ